MRRIFLIKIIIGTLIVVFPSVLMATVISKDDLSLKFNQFKQRKAILEELKTSGASFEQKLIQAKELLTAGGEVFSYSLSYYEQNLERLSGVDQNLKERHQADIASAKDWVSQRQLAIINAQEKDQLVAISREMAVRWQDLKNQTASARAELLVSKIKIVLVDIEDASRLINDIHAILINKGKSSEQATQAVNELNQELNLAQEKYNLAKAASDELENASQSDLDFSQKIIIIREARNQTESAKNKIKPAIGVLEDLILISE